MLDQTMRPVAVLRPISGTAAAVRGRNPLRVIQGVSADVLPAIDRLDVKLAIWDRASPLGLEPMAFEDFVSLRFVTDADRVAARLAELLSPGLPERAVLIADVSDLARRFAAIMRCGAVEIRLDRISGNACWKFHADYVPVRLLCTYLGQGTQWLRDDDARIRNSSAPVRSACSKAASARPRIQSSIAPRRSLGPERRVFCS